jgi:protein-S-isoprenylcysteine O-methyltransferase Ste14
MTHTDHTAAKSTGPTIGTWIGLTIYIAITLVLMFWPAGTIDWRRGWLFITLFTILMFVAVGWIARDNPELFAARSKFQKGTKPWDAVVASLSIVLFVAIVPIAALDDVRYRWLPTPDWVTFAGYALLTLGFMGVTWAQATNRHFEPTVRIQSDHDHKVIDTGPYAHIRHPGYAFAIPFAAGIALSLGSLAALIPVAILALLLAGRTLAEEAVLREGLPGYTEYASRVKYRWLPFVW